MNKTWDQKLLEELELLFTEMGMEAYVQENSGRNVLTLEYTDAFPAEDADLSIVHLTEDSTALSLLITVASGLDRNASAAVYSMLPFLNQLLTVGHFGLMEENGYFYYSYTTLIDETIDREMLMKLISTALTIAESTAAQAAAITAPVIHGEQTAAEQMNRVNPITQF